jgi:hypothetical protein
VTVPDPLTGDPQWPSDVELIRNEAEVWDGEDDAIAAQFRDAADRLAALEALHAAVKRVETARGAVVRTSLAYNAAVESDEPDDGLWQERVSATSDAEDAARDELEGAMSAVDAALAALREQEDR